MEQFGTDLRLARRQLRKDPVFAAVIIVTLGVGIGANASLLSVINGILLRPLPVQDPQRLVVLATRQEKEPMSRGLSYPDFLDYRRDLRVFSDLLGYYADFVGSARSGQADRILVSFVSGNYFSMLGVQAAAGRMILPEEGRAAGADPVVVLGHGYWQRRLGGDPKIVGQRLLINGRPFTIVGVAPASFRGLLTSVEMEAYLPLAMKPRFATLKDLRNDHTLRVMGRLRPSATLREAQAALNVESGRLATQYRATNQGVTIRAFPERLARPEPELADLWPPLIAVFMGLVGLVLLVACFNVANLLLVRETQRRGDTAVRLALGADRSRLLRQLFTETVLLGVAGGAMGLLIALGGIRFLESIPLSEDVPTAMDFGLDWRVLAFVVALVLGSCILFGLAPALQASRTNIAKVLHERGRSPGGVGRNSLRKALVVVQIAVSMVLLIAAGLFVRSLGKARGIDLGFNTKNVLTVSLDPSLQGYDAPRTESFFRRLRDGAAALPGVRSAALAYAVPMGHYELSAKTAAEGRLPAAGEVWPSVSYNSVGAGFFATIGIPIVHGRDFSAHDVASSPRVAIVNQTMAAKLWSGQEALGKRFILGPGGPAVEVVGIAKDGKYGFLFEPPQPFFYVPLEQEPKSLRVLYLASTVAPASLGEAVRRLVRDLDSTVPAFGIETLDTLLHNDVNGFLLPQLAAAIAGTLGLLGLFLAVIGIYGVVSFTTSRRTHEIGIRMALGAKRQAIMTMVVRQGLWLALVGVALGAPLAFLMARLLSSLLYGIKPGDPVTFVAVAVVLMAVTLFACVLPARRASRIHPTFALRFE